MKVPFFLVIPLMAIVVVAKPEPRMVPQIQLREWASRSDVPTVDITFPDGHVDTLAISRHYPSEESRRERQLHCNFIGHLENEMSACVGMTGCPGESDMVELTIFSEHNDGYYMYQWNKDGSVEGVTGPDKKMFKGMLRDDIIEGEDKNDQDKDDQGSNEKAESLVQMRNTVANDNCATNGNCEPFKPAYKIKIQVFYDTNFTKVMESKDKKTPDEYIDAVFTHVLTNYCDSKRLGTKVQLEFVGGKTYDPTIWTNRNLDPRPCMKAAINSKTEANLYSFFTHQLNLGAAGRGYLGEVCGKQRKFRINVTARLWTPMMTSISTTHEMGHNFGMNHDFDNYHKDIYKNKATGETVNLGTHKGQGCAIAGQDGVMDYDYKTGWSTCSSFDLLNYCRSVDNCACLQEVLPSQTSCGGPDPTVA